MNIYFARHGETDWNIAKRIQGTTDIPLNENGIRQAELLCDNLEKEKVHLGRIYSSYQKRALTTAEIVGARYHVPVKVMEGLEEMNLGLFEGHTWDEVDTLFSEEFKTWESDKRYNRAPGGESYQDLLKRVSGALVSIMEEGKEDTDRNSDILILTHGAVIMSLLTVKMGLDFKTSYRYINVENAKPFCFDEKELKEIVILIDDKRIEQC
ncbi:MAG: histidine phosphatase family protein [Acetatifactor sp.]